MSPGVVRALIAWPLLMAEMFSFGTAAFVLAVSPPGAGERRRLQAAFRLWWRIFSVTVLILSPLGLLVQAADMANVPLSKAFALLSEVVSDTHAGRMWGWRLALSVLFIIAAWMPPAKRLTKAATTFAVTATLLALSSLSSHGIDDGMLSVTAYFIHEAAAALWMGSLFGLWLSYAQARMEDPWIERAAWRTSRVAGWSVAVLVITGLYNAYNALGVNLDQAIYSAYGRILLLKVALFATVLGIGGYNRYRLVPEVEYEVTRTFLLRTVAIEAMLLIVVLGMAALLANTAPPHLQLNYAGN